MSRLLKQLIRKSYTTLAPLGFCSIHSKSRNNLLDAPYEQREQKNVVGFFLNSPFSPNSFSALNLLPAEKMLVYPETNGAPLIAIPAVMAKDEADQ